MDKIIFTSLCGLFIIYNNLKTKTGTNMNHFKKINITEYNNLKLNKENNMNQFNCFISWGF